MRDDNDRQSTVLVIGGGFGGLHAARALADAPVRVILVDRCNYHLFQPLLYQVATAVLSPSDIAAPLRHVLRRQANVEVVLGEALAIDPGQRRVRLADGEIVYDHLIVAAGATHSYFGHDEWAAGAPGLKTIEDALDIRRRVLLAYEAAEREPDEERRRAWMTFVIVGAGATGVELAGALAEIARQALRGDFRHIDTAEARVVLVEGLDRVLPAYDAVLSASARRQLEALGVEVVTRARVTGIDAGGVVLATVAAGGGAAVAGRIAARTAIWAAGVSAAPLARSLGVPLDHAGRVLVEPDLTVPGHPEIYVVGDLAALSIDGKAVPGVAPAAMQEGRHAAANVRASLSGRARAPFRYVDRGQLATIGRRAAVGTIGGVRLAGVLAWLAWALVHILHLIGFRNRVLVLLEWAWSYFTFQRGARLITGAPHPRLLAAAAPADPAAAPADPAAAPADPAAAPTQRPAAPTQPPAAPASRAAGSSAITEEPPERVPPPAR